MKITLCPSADIFRINLVVLSAIEMLLVLEDSHKEHLAFLSQVDVDGKCIFSQAVANKLIRQSLAIDINTPTYGQSQCTKCRVGTREIIHVSADLDR